jgi:hypothetical protein
MDPRIDAYFRGYDKESFAVFTCQGNEPSEADVEAFERTVGFRLPDEFRDFTMSALGGLYMEVREELWPRADLYAVGPFWSFLYGLKVFGISADIPEWLDLRVQYVELGQPKLVPFLEVVGDPNPWCFESTGRIVRWSHEGEAPDPVALGFNDLLLSEIRELEERKERKLRSDDKR